MAFDQLGAIPRDSTHLVLSVGGNDAIWVAGSLLPQDTVDVRDALEKLGAIRQEFLREHQRLISELQTRRLLLVVCTVYAAIPGLGASESAGLVF